MLIDTHCHLDDYNEEELKIVLEHMKNHIMIVSGVNDATNQGVFELCHRYDNIYGTVGIHPEEIDSIQTDSFLQMEKMLQDDKIVAVGEIGLDYHYTKENIEKQKEVFIRQIELAHQYQKAVVIHSRDAIQDTYDILYKYKDSNIPFVLHAYSGSVEMAKQFTDLGVILGIGGVVTFKNAEKLKEVVEIYSLSHFVLETDSPYLTPEPYRGTKNEPYHTLLVAEKIAEIKKVRVEQVIEETSKNAIQTFSLPIDLQSIEERKM